MSLKSYSELKKLKTYEERVKYLMTKNKVGEETFADRRVLNQNFYRSREWKRLRDQIIIRDKGNDLGLEGMEISGKIIIHHINPITDKDIENGNKCIMDPDNLISVSDRTHNIIHYNDEKQIEQKKMLTGDRKPGDTKLW